MKRPDVLTLLQFLAPAHDWARCFRHHFYTSPVDGVDQSLFLRFFTLGLHEEVDECV